MRNLSVVQRLRSSRSADRLAIWGLAHPGLRPGWDLAGVLFAIGLALIAWTVQERTEVSSVPVIRLVLVSIVVVVVAGSVGVLTRIFVPLMVALAISYVAYDWRGDLLGGPLSGPFGYRNAFGALLLQGGFAWLVAGFAVPHPAVRVLSLIPAAVLGVLAVGSSMGAAAGATLLVFAALSLLGRKGTRAAMALCGLATATVLAGTIWLGADYQPGNPGTGFAGRVADAGITERRLALWHDALVIVGEHPSGIGHGRFETTSPTALSDRDAMYAHNEFLEQGAELGWAGMFLTVLLVAWAFVRLAINDRADVVTALSGVALAGLAIHACIDYVWHFPAIPLAAAALVGTGIATARSVRKT